MFDTAKENQEKNQEMKREKNKNLVNQNLIEIIEESTTSKNIQRAVNPCGCIHTHTHTFSLNEYILQFPNSEYAYFCE